MIERLVLNLDLQGHQPLLWEGEGMDVGCVPIWLCPMWMCLMKICYHVDVGYAPSGCGMCSQWMWDMSMLTPTFPMCGISLESMLGVWARQGLAGPSQ